MKISIFSAKFYWHSLRSWRGHWKNRRTGFGTRNSCTAFGMLFCICHLIWILIWWYAFVRSSWVKRLAQSRLLSDLLIKDNGKLFLIVRSLNPRWSTNKQRILFFFRTNSIRASAGDLESLIKSLIMLAMI